MLNLISKTNEEISEKREDINKALRQSKTINEKYSKTISRMQKEALSVTKSSSLEKLNRIGFFGASGGFLKEFERIKNDIKPSCKIVLFDSDEEKWGTKFPGPYFDAPPRRRKQAGLPYY